MSLKLSILPHITNYNVKGISKFSLTIPFDNTMESKCIECMHDHLNGYVSQILNDMSNENNYYDIIKTIYACNEVIKLTISIAITYIKKHMRQFDSCSFIVAVDDDTDNRLYDTVVSAYVNGSEIHIDFTVQHDYDNHILSRYSFFSIYNQAKEIDYKLSSEDEFNTAKSILNTFISNELVPCVAGSIVIDTMYNDDRGSYDKDDKIGSHINTNIVLDSLSDEDEDIKEFIKEFKNIFTEELREYVNNNYTGNIDEFMKIRDKLFYLFDTRERYTDIAHILQYRNSYRNNTLRNDIKMLVN